jgi:hypothetical protein
MQQQSKFFRPGPARRHSPTEPQTAPKRLVEELSTQKFEFPHARGPQQAPNTAMPAQQAQPTPIVTPKSQAELDPAFVSINLPSGFKFYGGQQSLSSRTLLASHQAKFSRAAKEQKLRYSVEAIGATLEEGWSAFDLTPGDFYFLMYWQRVNSYSKNPMIITAYCDNEAHNEKVYLGHEVPDPDNPEKTKLVKLDEQTLMNEVMVNNTSLDTKYLEQLDTSDLDVAKKFRLDVERMRDIVEVTEYLSDKDGDIPEEELFLLQYTSFLARVPGQETLRERMDIVSQMTPDDLVGLDEYIKRVTDYGVSEYSIIKCKECGASMRVKISFDALTFLPSNRRN